jgi:hypothetical protein
MWCNEFYAPMAMLIVVPVSLSSEEYFSGKDPAMKASFTIISNRPLIE